MAAIALQVAELQAEFQRIADVHPWVCLAVPSKGSEFRSLLVGEAIDYPKALMVFPGVRTPEDRSRIPVVNHVDDLTRQANRALYSSLEETSQVPADIAQEIREWGDETYGFGWIRWLWYSTPFCHASLIENYPQVAASSLMALQRCLAGSEAGQQSSSLDGGHSLPPARHSIDFRSVHWYGTVYFFNETQAAIVAVLWEAWENGTPEVGNRTLLSKATASSDRLPDLFKVKGEAVPAWGAMIQVGIGSKGSTRLCPPVDNFS